MPKQRGGKPLILQPANYTGSPIGSNKILTGRGCSGTTSNIDAASGKFIQQNGGYSFGKPIGDINGPYGVYPEVIKGTVSPINNPLAMGAGTSETIKDTLARLSENQSGGKKTRSNKKVNKRSKKNNKRSKKNNKRSKKNNKRSKKNNKRSKKNNKRSYTKKSYKYRGGANQPYSNNPISFGYNLGGELSPNESALANPPLFQKYNNCPSA